MKTSKTKIESKKFDLDKMQVAKLKNMHLIKGGDGDDPIDTNRKTVDASSARCTSND
jgi:hypothetical protein